MTKTKTPKNGMRHKRFAVFILTHGRADNVLTVQTIRNQGYTGTVYYVVDDEDKTLDKYREQFGDSVLVFSKEYYFLHTDTMDAGGPRSVILPARNACFDLARDKGLDYFLELDDDYSSFQYRYNEDNKLRGSVYPNLNAVFDAYLDFLDVTPAVTVAFTQGGDFIGGKSCANTYKGLLRKAMNSFFCRTDRPFKFLGRINEDVNTYTTLSNRGVLFFSTARSMLTQMTTQKQSGGMSGTYIDGGTYMKTFYSVLSSPQAVKVSTMGDHYRRIHHFVDWNKCAPKILNPKFRKI